MQQAITEAMKRYGKPTPEDIERAKMELLDNQGKSAFGFRELYVSKDPQTFKAQVKTWAMRYVVQRQAPAVQPQDEAIRRAAEAKQAEIAKDYSICVAMVGADSMYSRLSLLDGNTYNTAVISFLRNEFHGKQNCLLLGITGSGKTYGAIAYVSRFAKKPHEAAFISAHKLSVMINRRQYDALDKFEKVKYLILDDLGISGAGYKGEDFVAWFEDLFSYRHQNQRITILTSNATKDQIKEAYGERFVSRFMETGVIYTTPDKDMRRETQN